VSVAERVAALRARLPPGVTLVAVSKTHGAEAIREAYAAGQRDFGENYAQEWREKADALADLADSLGNGLSIWVNNAGVYPSTPVVDVEDREWERVMRITLDGTFYGCRAAARKMVARPDLPGRVIVNMSSLSGLRGRANLSSYVASKHAVTGLVRSLALELGGSGVRVVGLAPSVVDTPGMRQRRAEADPSRAEEIKQMEASIAASIPLGRVGLPDDVARAALYLVSPLAEWISGVVMPIDGGVSAG